MGRELEHIFKKENLITRGNPLHRTPSPRPLPPLARTPLGENIDRCIIKSWKGVVRKCALYK